MGDLCRLCQNLREAQLLAQNVASLEGIQVMWKRGGSYLQQPHASAAQLGGGGEWIFVGRKELDEMAI